MIPISFNYKKANSVDEAITMINADTKILGGGQSLIPALKLRFNSVETLIDISSIAGIQSISNNEKSISIGGGATHASIAANSDLASHIPMMTEAALTIGDRQVRNRGTIGGSMAHADPAADWPAALLVTDCNVIIKGAGGQREVDIDQFFTGFYETALGEGEIITGIRIPKNGINANSVYEKFKQPASRFAIVGIAAGAEMDGNRVKNIRIGVTGLSEFAYRAMAVEKALVGKELNEANIDAAVGAIADGVAVMGDHYASEKYRTHLAKVYTKKALMRLG